MRSGFFRTLTLAAAVAAATAGCREDVTGLDTDNSALVYGTVSDSSGNPVDSATVRTTAFSNLCGSRVSVTSETRTDSRGHYADTLLFFRTRFRGCLSVRADPPVRSGLQSEVVRLATRSILSAGLDSVELNFTLDRLPAGETPNR